jgi:hypothetical protein
MSMYWAVDNLSKAKATSMIGENTAGICSNRSNHFGNCGGCYCNDAGKNVDWTKCVEEQGLVSRILLCWTRSENRNVQHSRRS